jgi:hypothetical protein
VYLNWNCCQRLFIEECWQYSWRETSTLFRIPWDFWVRSPKNIREARWHRIQSWTQEFRQVPAVLDISSCRPKTKLAVISVKFGLLSHNPEATRPPAASLSRPLCKHFPTTSELSGISATPKGFEGKQAVFGELVHRKRRRINAVSSEEKIENRKIQRNTAFHWS